MEAVWWRRPSTLPLVLLGMALVIIVAGGTIRINDAGESCPDWPQCFGTWGFDISDGGTNGVLGGKPRRDRFTRRGPPLHNVRNFHRMDSPGDGRR